MYRSIRRLKGCTKEKRLIGPFFVICTKFPCNSLSRKSEPLFPWRGVTYFLKTTLAPGHLYSANAIIFSNFPPQFLILIFVHTEHFSPPHPVITYFHYNFQLCFEGTYEPLVFLKNPHTFFSAIVFGDSQNTKKCPKDQARMDITLIYGTDSRAMELYTNRTLETDHSCPREILLFNPPPLLPYCSIDNYRLMTSAANFEMRLTFSNVSLSFHQSTFNDSLFFLSKIFVCELDAEFVQ